MKRKQLPSTAPTAAARRIKAGKLLHQHPYMKHPNHHLFPSQSSTLFQPSSSLFHSRGKPSELSFSDYGTHSWIASGSMMADYTMQYGPESREHFSSYLYGKMLRDFQHGLLERNGPLSTSRHWLFQKKSAACDWPKQIVSGAFFITALFETS